MSRHTFFLIVDSKGNARVTKRAPATRTCEYVWRVRLTLPDPPPHEEIELAVPEPGKGELVDVDRVQ